MEVLIGSGVRTHVKALGAGSPVLFLHGNPDTSDLWGDVMTRMGSRHRCLAPDLPGFGQSEVPVDLDCSLDGLAGWVHDLTNALGIDRPLDLVVHDFGGLFGLAWAVRHPERVRRIAIMNTVFFPDFRWHFWARVWRTPVLGEISFALNSRWALTLEMRRGSKRLPVAHARKVYDAITPTMTRTVLRLYRAADPQLFTPWQDGLRTLVARVPCLVLWGDRDPYIGARFAERFGARQVVHFPDAGHWLPVEEADAVAAHLIAFFE
jgi:pimeloyl-ACP methyl ester carboxylesterase